MFYCSEDCWNGAHDEYSTLLHQQLHTNDLIVKLQILDQKLFECHKLFAEIRTEITKSKPHPTENGQNFHEIPKIKSDLYTKVLVEDSNQDSDNFGSMVASPIHSLHHPPIHNYLHDDDILANHHIQQEIVSVLSDPEVVKKRARPPKEEKEPEVLPTKKKLRLKSPKKRNGRLTGDRRKRSVVSSDDESPQKAEKRKSGRGKKRETNTSSKTENASVPGKRKRGRPPKVPKPETTKHSEKAIDLEGPSD
jgi:hypothetical protein